MVDENGKNYLLRYEFERTGLSFKHFIKLFQGLANSGELVQLEGRYQRIAKDLIDKRLISLPILKKGRGKLDLVQVDNSTGISGMDSIIKLLGVPNYKCKKCGKIYLIFNLYENKLRICGKCKEL